MLKEAEIFFRFFWNALPRYGSFHQVMPSLRVQRLGTGAGRIDTFMTRSNHMSYKSPTCLSKLVCDLYVRPLIVAHHLFRLGGFLAQCETKKGS